jgi:hypothetical protein
MADVSRFLEPDKVGIVCRGSQHRGEYLVKEDGMEWGEGVGREAFVSNYYTGGHVSGVTIKGCVD